MEAFATGVQSQSGKSGRYYFNVPTFSSFKACPVKKKKKNLIHDLFFCFQCVDGSINDNIPVSLSLFKAEHHYRNRLFSPISEGHIFSDLSLQMLCCYNWKGCSVDRKLVGFSLEGDQGVGQSRRDRSVPVRSAKSKDPTPPLGSAASRCPEMDNEQHSQQTPGKCSQDPLK